MPTSMNKRKHKAERKRKKHFDRNLAIFSLSRHSRRGQRGRAEVIELFCKLLECVRSGEGKSGGGEGGREEEEETSPYKYEAVPTTARRPTQRQAQRVESQQRLRVKTLGMTVPHSTMTSPVGSRQGIP